MKNKHTLGPWHKDNSHDEPYYEIWHGKIGDWDRKLIAEYVKEANAEFIVKACNSHDELVKACERILPTIVVNHMNGAAFNNFKQALAKAGGKE